MSTTSPSPSPTGTLASATLTTGALPIVTPCYVTFAYVQSLGLNPASITAQQITDANTVYTQIAANPWASQASLATWATTTFGTADAIDRLNGALSLLQQAGLIATIGAS